MGPLPRSRGGRRICCRQWLGKFRAWFRCRLRDLVMSASHAGTPLSISQKLRFSSCSASLHYNSNEAMRATTDACARPKPRARGMTAGRAPSQATESSTLGKPLYVSLAPRLKRACAAGDESSPYYPTLPTNVGAPFRPENPPFCTLSKRACRFGLAPFDFLME
jgi:hypothetical protein